MAQRKKKQSNKASTRRRKSSVHSKPKLLPTRTALKKAVAGVSVEHDSLPDGMRETSPGYGPAEHEAGLLSSVREAMHAGHHIKVRTTYEVEIDHQPVHIHATVDDRGRLLCHATPYERYTSAIDLIKSLIEKYPDQLAGGRHH